MNVEDQYMDDLFGEDNHVPHIATSAPAAKGLARRLDALASSNCCNKIAWSRFGCIASISANSRRVDLRVLTRSPKTGEWRLPKPVLLWPPLPDDHELVHLAWSAVGNDLAVVDSAGRLMLYTTGSTLGSMVLVHTAMNESEDELNSIVALHWLPVFPHTQKSAIFWSASRNNDTWTVRNQQHIAPGPHNPLEGKSALVCLTRRGTLRLIWHARSNSWSEVNVELGDAASAAEYSFTHAAFVPDNDNSLLLVAHQVRTVARIYRVNINWNMPPKPEVKTENEQQAQPPPAPSPVLDTKALLEETFFYPTSLPSHSQDDGTNGHAESTYSFQLSKLIFVPLAPEQGTREPTQQTIIAVFTIVPPRSPMLLDPSHQWQQVTSLICRWEVQRDLLDKLSPCFDQLSVKKKSSNGVPPRHRLRLKRLDDITISPAVLSILPIRNDTMFALTLCDGTVQFRYRNSMDVVMPDDSPDEVQSLPQSGFAFQPLDPCLNTALSPGACVIASLEEDGAVKLEKMYYMHGSLAEMDENDAKHDAVAAIIALQYSSACMQYKVSDDVMSMLPKDLSISLSRTLVTLCTKFLNVDFDMLASDFNKQIMPLFRNHLPSRCFSLQNALGAADKSGPRKLTARLAWITLNLRHVAQNIFFNLRPEQQLKPELAISFVGLVKWSLDLIIYVLQELLTIHYAIKHENHAGHPDRAKDHPWVQQRILEHHSPAILLLLSSMPRVLLRLLFRPLKHGFVHSSNGFKAASSMEQKGAFHKLLGVYQSTPIAHANFEHLEKFAMEVDSHVKEAYTAASCTSQQRAQIERDMVLSGTVPGILMPAVSAMLTDGLDTLKAKMDPGKIHVHDVSWLGLTDDRRTRHFHEGHTIDVIRKMPLASSVKLRLCPRCGSVMEDIAQAPGHHQPWVWQSHKVCVCWSSWASPEGKGE